MLLPVQFLVLPGKVKVEKKEKHEQKLRFQIKTCVNEKAFRSSTIRVVVENSEIGGR